MPVEGRVTFNQSASTYCLSQTVFSSAKWGIAGGWKEQVCLSCERAVQQESLAGFVERVAVRLFNEQGTRALLAQFHYLVAAVRGGDE